MKIKLACSNDTSLEKKAVHEDHIGSSQQGCAGKWGSGPVFELKYAIEE